MLLVLFVILSILLLLKIYAVITLGKCNSKSKLNGKIALVTGANRGIGYYTALNLAKRGAKVIITSENLEDLKKAQKQMILESGNNDIVAKHLDFLSLTGVRCFAKDILQTESRLDIMVNNAGSFGHGFKHTKDGLLPVMQINYFGPFLLTILLLGILKKSAPSRIVNVASTASNIGLVFDSSNISRVNGPDVFKELFEYCNSKICTVSTTIEMAKRLKGTGVTVNCLHPGLVYTKIYNQKGWSGILKELGKFYFKNAAEGAETTIHLAACEKVEGVTGKYFSDCRASKIWANLNFKTRNRIWEQSIKLSGLAQEEMII